MKKQLADFVFANFKKMITLFVFLSVLLNFLLIFEHSSVCDRYQHQINDLKSELKTKNKQIDGLHGQLRRTQYQLKKAREQNVEQTNKIAELTGNGG